jgi:hypothetical protein
MLAGHPSLVHYVVTMNKNMEKNLFHSVPTEMAVDRSMLPPPFEVSEGGQRVNFGIQSKLQNTTRKIPHVGLLSDALTFSLQQSKEVSLHGIAADASSPCIIFFLAKNTPDLPPDSQHFRDRVSLSWNGLNLRVGFSFVGALCSVCLEAPHWGLGMCIMCCSPPPEGGAPTQWDPTQELTPIQQGLHPRGPAPKGSPLKGSHSRGPIQGGPHSRSPPLKRAPTQGAPFKMTPIKGPPLKWAPRHKGSTQAGPTQGARMVHTWVFPNRGHTQGARLKGAPTY